MQDANVIAAAVQQGQEDISELWQVVRRFAMKQAYRWSKAMGERDKHDPLNNFPLALDTPLDENGDLTLADVIPDPLAETAFDALTLHIAIENALATLPPEEKCAIVGEFWRGQRANAKTRSSALRHLRHPTVSRSLKAYLDTCL